MSPLETQVREHHLQLRRRLESIRRIHQASDELEDRIAELEQQEAAIKAQVKGLMIGSRKCRRDRPAARRAATGRQRLIAGVSRKTSPPASQGTARDVFLVFL